MKFVDFTRLCVSRKMKNAAFMLPTIYLVCTRYIESFRLIVSYSLNRNRQLLLATQNQLLTMMKKVKTMLTWRINFTTCLSFTRSIFNLQLTQI